MSRRLSLVSLLLLAAVPPGRAAGDIVVLATGGFLKVDAYEVGTDSVRVELPIGGAMILPMSNVEAIIDDEILGDEAGFAAFDLDGVNLDFSAGEPMLETEYIGQFAQMFHEVGRRYSLNPRLLASIARAESNFEPWARSNKGAIGIMQVMPATAERFGVDPGQLYDPLVCMDVGARYLSTLRQRYDGDLALMLAAYNAGEATVERFGGVPPYHETQTYIRRVYRTYTEGLERAP